MATKAQEFRTQSERTGHARKAMHHPHKPEAGERLSHNEAQRVDKKSTHAIEEPGERPSRKSTRGGANRAKPDSAQRITARVKNETPEARAARRR
jgi:hypothetical protein